MSDVPWIALSLTGRIGNKTLQSLLSHFDGNTSAILHADAKTLRQVHGVGPKIAESIRAIDLKRVETALVHWRQLGIQIWTIRDANYPPQLKLLDDAPPTLFLRGDQTLKFEKCVAIVGTRNPTDSTRNYAQNLSTLLVERGYTIISGMALGIDSAAHYGAIIHPEGRTVAVLGSGVLNVYPPNHEKLAEKIMLAGVVLSEINPSAATSPSQLVARNRIITGLSEMVIVVETAVDGGAMHAARFAVHQGRPIYTVDNQSTGNQALIASGAKIMPSDLTELAF